MIESVTKTVSFGNLVVEVSAYRYICDGCGKRECFPDSPMPYPDQGPKPWQRGWALGVGADDEQTCHCKTCSAKSLAEFLQKNPKLVASLPSPPSSGEEGENK